MSIREPNNTALAGSVMEPDQMSQLVERICSSRHFRRSQRLSSFLAFICTEALAGNSKSICEQAIGQRVFGRAPDYDPTSDNIVRVEATQLRKRLESYFVDEGAREPIIIRVPKGRYVPVFEPAAVSPEAALPVLPQELPAPLPLLAPERKAPAGRKHFLLVVLASLALIATGADVYVRLKNTSLPQSQVQPVGLPKRFAAFWSKFYTAQPALFCVADSNLSLLQDLRGESISFTEYTSGQYLSGLKNNSSDRTLSMIASRYYTSLGDATALARLMSVNWKQGPVAVRFARDLNIRDLRTGNLVLLGSARSNPWIELLDPKLRFHIEYDTKANRPVLRDAGSRPKVYPAGQQGDKPYDAYGIAAVVPNLDRTGYAILVAGSNMQGTEAATEFLTNPAAFDRFLSRIEWKTEDSLPLFEVVMKLVTVGGSPTSSEIFAYQVPER